MTATDWSTIPSDQPNIRLVVCDLDGTLLTDDGQLPDEFWPIFHEMQSRSIVFAPASGRQYAMLAKVFGDETHGISYIAENGNLVIHEGEAIHTTSVEPDHVAEVIDRVRSVSSERDIGLVVCGLDSAYAERSDRAFLDEADKYYAKLKVVDDLHDTNDTVLKLAVFDFKDAEAALKKFDDIDKKLQTVVSGKHWVDIMAPGVDKGQAVRDIQQALGISRAETAAFGDYLNDLEMLEAADWSFAVSNAHDTIRDRARYLAPSNADGGVTTVLKRLLGLTC